MSCLALAPFSLYRVDLAESVRGHSRSHRAQVPVPTRPLSCSYLRGRHSHPPSFHTCNGLSVQISLFRGRQSSPYAFCVWRSMAGSTFELRIGGMCKSRHSLDRMRTAQACHWRWDPFDQTWLESWSPTAVEPQPLVREWPRTPTGNQCLDGDRPPRRVKMAGQNVHFRNCRLGYLSGYIQITTDYQGRVAPSSIRF
jgi:hypothetical protein